MSVLAVILVSVAISLVSLIFSCAIWGASAVVSAVVRAFFWVISLVLRVLVVGVIRLFYATRGVVTRLR